MAIHKRQRAKPPKRYPHPPPYLYQVIRYDGQVFVFVARNYEEYRTFLDSHSARGRDAFRLTKFYPCEDDGGPVLRQTDLQHFGPIPEPRFKKDLKVYVRLRHQ